MAHQLPYPIRSVVISGASRGLGRALAHAFGRRGASIALVARGEEALAETRLELRRAGIEAEYFVADVANKSAIYPLAAQVHDYLGEVDLLINAASTLGPTPLRRLLDTDCEDLTAVLETNLVGPFRLAKALLGPMLARGRGAVLNISSDAAIAPYAHWGAYAASKAAQDQLSAVWDEEVRGQGPRVLALDPGEMDTVMHAAAMPDADPSRLSKPEWVARWVAERLPMWLVEDVRRYVAPSRDELSANEGANA